MDWLQSVSSLVSNIVWPAVTLTFLFMFRSELTKIVQRLTHLKYKDLEFDFEKVKQQAEDLHLETTQKTSIIFDPALTSLEDQIMDAVERAPSAAILLAWSGTRGSHCSCCCTASYLAGIPILSITYAQHRNAYPKWPLIEKT